MPLKITQRWAVDVPSPGSSGKVNSDLEALKSEMKRISAGMVLEIQPDGKSLRAAKGLVTRASRELGARWRHWSAGGKVYAEPMQEARRRGRPKKTV